MRDDDGRVGVFGRAVLETARCLGKPAGGVAGNPQLRETTQAPIPSQATRVARPPRRRQPVMILPQVHLRKPCYDFYFL